MRSRPAPPYSRAGERRAAQRRPGESDGTRPNPCKTSQFPNAKCCQKPNGGEYCCPDNDFWFCGGKDNGYRCIDKCKLAGQQARTRPWTRWCYLCTPGEPICGLECCPPGETCQKCIESQTGGAVWFVKGRRQCCPPDSECCGSMCHKKSDGRVCCNGKLCPKGKDCVNLPASSGRVGLTCG